jgi:hypothetical protein
MVRVSFCKVHIHVERSHQSRSDSAEEATLCSHFPKKFKLIGDGTCQTHHIEEQKPARSPKMGCIVSI